MYIRSLAFAKARVLFGFSWFFFISHIQNKKGNEIRNIFLPLIPYFMCCSTLFLTLLSVFVFPPIIYCHRFCSYFSCVKLPPAHLFHPKLLIAAAVLLLPSYFKTITKTF